MTCSSPELVIEPFFELSEDSDDDRRILANDLRTREKRSYEYEWNVLNGNELHTNNARKLAVREAEWLMPIPEMEVCPGKGALDGHDPIFGVRAVERVEYADFAPCEDDAPANLAWVDVKEDTYAPSDVRALYECDKLYSGTRSPFKHTVGMHDFEERFVTCSARPGVSGSKARGKPCILKHLARTERWPALSLWGSADSFTQRFADVPVHMTEMFEASGLGKAHKIRVPVSQYVAYARENTADFPYYPFERCFEAEGRAAFLRDWTQPRLFSEDLFDVELQRVAGFRQQPAASMMDINETVSSTRSFFPYTCHRFVLIGGKRTGANLHKDPKGSAAWNCLLAGRKRWVFFPPDADIEAIGAKSRGYNFESPVNWWLDVYPSLVGRAQELGMLECVQEADETVPHPKHHQICQRVLFDRRSDKLLTEMCDWL
jgi:hypothetical protein